MSDLKRERFPQEKFLVDLQLVYKNLLYKNILNVIDELLEDYWSQWRKLKSEGNKRETFKN